MRSIEVAGQKYEIRYGRREARWMENEAALAPKGRRNVAEICFSYVVEDQNVVVLGGIRGGNLASKLTLADIDGRLQEHEERGGDAQDVWKECLREILESKIVPRNASTATTLANMRAMLDEEGKAAVAQTAKPGE